MKNILITGATDGIGFETVKMLAEQGHHLMLHGRNREKLERVKSEVLEINPTIAVSVYQADFSKLSSVREMADSILQEGKKIDVLINNAGLFVVDQDEMMSQERYDVRFSVNTIAPYILTKRLLPIMSGGSRVVNLSSAAQVPLDLESLMDHQPFTHDAAYAQSKLAIIMWGLELAKNYPNGPMVVAVNPKSFLGSKMVKKAYGRTGYDLEIGADILCRAALSEEFADANGAYYDNDYGVFGTPHSAVLDEDYRMKLVAFLDSLV